MGLIRVGEEGDVQIEITVFGGSTDINPKTISESPGGRGGVCHSKDGRTIALAVEDGAEGRRGIVLRDSRQLTSVQQWKAHDKEINGLLYDTSGSYLASRCHRFLKVWNVDDQQPVTSAPIPDRFLALTDLVLLEDGFAGVYLNVSTDETGVYKVTPTDREFVTVSTLQDIGKPVHSAAISGDGKTVAAFCFQELEQAELWIYDGPSGNPLYRLHGRDTAEPDELVFAPSGSRLAGMFFDHSISVWDLKTKQIIVTFTGFCGSVVGMFFPDDDTLLVSDWRNLTVWDLTRIEVDH